MADIQTGRFGRLVQSVFNLKQRMTLGQVLPDVMPTFSLSNLPSELQLHANNDLCVGTAVEAASPGNSSKIALQMPLNSGKVAVIEQIHVANVGAAAQQVRVALAAGTVLSDGGNLEQFRDTRRPGRPVCQIRRGTAALSGGQCAVLAVPVGQTVVLAVPFVLGTGLLTGAQVATALQLENVTLNEALTATFYWRERELEPQENVLS